METLVPNASLGGKSVSSYEECPVVPFGLKESIIQKCDFQAPEQSLGSISRAKLPKTMPFPRGQHRTFWLLFHEGNTLEIAIWLPPPCGVCAH